MRRLLIALLFVFASLPVAGVNTVVVMRHAAAGGGAFCDGTFAFCDDFSSASDPPTNWTEIIATTWINNGTVLLSPTSGTNPSLVRTTNMGSSDQYVIFKFVNNAVGDMGLVMRHDGTSGTSTFADIVYFGGGDLWWGVIRPSGAFIADVANCTYAPVAGDYISASVTGTGSGRTVKVWISTTAPTGAPTGTATCTFVGGTSANFVSPATAASCSSSCAGSSNTTDDGLKAGVWLSGIDSNKQFDDFAAGP